ncbi:hypothetical protein PL81_12745 [Streptomyces sp. RSD-27]|nr:hypothetical protein PL81_12745 [Streptomyces sp. RSD-27]
MRGPEAIQRRSLQILVSETAIVRSIPEVSTSASRAPWASKWSRASVSGSPVARATSAITAAENPGGVLIPVPTAVPPSGSSASLGRTACRRSIPYRIWAAYPPNSWPRVTGVASIRCVRPDLTTSANSAALRSRASSRWRRAGTRSWVTAAVAAMWMDEGKTSLELCEALTWSLGWTSRPSRSVARVAITSLVFMLDEVPEPVWKTSTGKCSSQWPSATSAAADRMASEVSSSSTPSSALTRAAAALIRARASMWARSRRCPESGKFSTARWVWARHLACAGTRTSPMESRSVRNAADC